MTDPLFSRVAEAINGIYAVPDEDPFEAYGITGIVALLDASSGGVIAISNADESGKLLASCSATTIGASPLVTELVETFRANRAELSRYAGAVAAQASAERTGAPSSAAGHLPPPGPGIPGHLLLGVIDARPETCYVIYLVRDERENSFSALECERLQSLLPHLRRALAIRRQLAGLRFDASALRAILDQAPFAIMLAESNGRVIYSNQGADRICELDDGIRLARARVRLSRPEDRVALGEALQRVSDPFNPHYGEQWILPVPRHSGKADFQLALMPISVALTGKASQQYIQLFIYDPAHREPLHGAALQSLHGLTDSETKVCELLYNDSDLAHVSQFLNISVNTTKTHLARIFQKIGVNSQKELMKYLAQAPKVGARKITGTN